MELERLDKLVATSLGISRKDARYKISHGSVSVNGKVSKDISYKADVVNDNIEVDGILAKYKKFVYFMMNKPKGVLSATNDKKRSTVVDIVKEQIGREDIFPVGRLDKDTTGLLLITNDGDFGHRIISPKSMLEKEYIATVDKLLTDDDINILENCVVLKDGTVCRPAKIKRTDCEYKISITITEGKYHEIKRMLGVVGAGVNELTRIRIGGLKLKRELNSGEFCELSDEELINVWKYTKNITN